MADFLRISRRRQAEDRDTIDLIDDRRPDPLVVMIGRVFNDGAMPAAVPGYFAVHQATLTGDEEEGAPAVITADTAAPAVFLVLGPEVPEVGDNLIGSLIDGRWVAGRMGGVEAVTLDITLIGCGPTPITGNFGEAAVTVTLYDSGENPVGDPITTTTGTFTAPGPGSYTVRVVADLYPAGAELPVTLIAGTNTATIRLGPCGTLSGTLILNDGTRDITVTRDETPGFSQAGYYHGTALIAATGWAMGEVGCGADEPVTVEVRYTLLCNSGFGFALLVEHTKVDFGGGPTTKYYVDHEDDPNDPGSCLFGQTLGAVSETSEVSTTANGLMECSPFLATFDMHLPDGLNVLTEYWEPLYPPGLTIFNVAESSATYCNAKATVTATDSCTSGPAEGVVVTVSGGDGREWTTGADGVVEVPLHEAGPYTLLFAEGTTFLGGYAAASHSATFACGDNPVAIALDPKNAPVEFHVTACGCPVEGIACTISGLDAFGAYNDLGFATTDANGDATITDMPVGVVLDWRLESLAFTTKTGSLTITSGSCSASVNEAVVVPAGNFCLPGPFPCYDPIPLSLFVTLGASTDFGDLASTTQELTYISETAGVYRWDGCFPCSGSALGGDHLLLIVEVEAGATCADEPVGRLIYQAGTANCTTGLIGSPVPVAMTAGQAACFVGFDAGDNVISE